MTTKNVSNLTKALLETAEGVHRVGVMNNATYRIITIRHFGPGRSANRCADRPRENPSVARAGASELRALTRSMNLPVGDVPQLKRETKQAERWAKIDRGEN